MCVDLLGSAGTPGVPVLLVPGCSTSDPEQPKAAAVERDTPAPSATADDHGDAAEAPPPAPLRPGERFQTLTVPGGPYTPSAPSTARTTTTASCSTRTWRPTPTSPAPTCCRATRTSCTTRSCSRRPGAGGRRRGARRADPRPGLDLLRRNRAAERDDDGRAGAGLGAVARRLGARRRGGGASGRAPAVRREGQPGDPAGPLQPARGHRAGPDRAAAPAGQPGADLEALQTMLLVGPVERPACRRSPVRCATGRSRSTTLVTRFGPTPGARWPGCSCSAAAASPTPGRRRPSTATGGCRGPAGPGGRRAHAPARPVDQCLPWTPAGRANDACSSGRSGTSTTRAPPS